MYIESEKLISVHIEKTAGTSINRFYEEYCGSENILYYHVFTNGFYRSSEHQTRRTSKTIDLIKKVLARTPAYPLIVSVRNKTFGDAKATFSASELGKIDFNIATGHFNADFLDGNIENPLRSVVLREPLARTISHFQHWKRTGGNAMFPDKIDLPASASFTDFAALPLMQDFQTRRLAGKELADFDAVGLTEALPDYAAQIAKLLPGNGRQPRVSRLNQNPFSINFQEMGIDDKFVKDFKRLNASDYYYYEEVKNFVDPQRTFSIPSFQ